MRPAAATFWRLASLPGNLERLGLVRCAGETVGGKRCTVYVDPVNVPELRCRDHQTSHIKRRPVR